MAGGKVLVGRVSFSDSFYASYASSICPYLTFLRGTFRLPPNFEWTGMTTRNHARTFSTYTATDYDTLLPPKNNEQQQQRIHFRYSITLLHHVVAVAFQESILLRCNSQYSSRLLVLTNALKEVFYCCLQCLSRPSHWQVIYYITSISSLQYATRTSLLLSISLFELRHSGERAREEALGGWVVRWCFPVGRSSSMKFHDVPPHIRKYAWII